MRDDCNTTGWLDEIFIGEGPGGVEGEERGEGRGRERRKGKGCQLMFL